MFYEKKLRKILGFFYVKNNQLFVNKIKFVLLLNLDLLKHNLDEFTSKNYFKKQLYNLQLN